MNNSAAHNELIARALEALAIAGYCAWKTGTGAYKSEETGTFIKYGKKGGADITMIVPRAMSYYNGNGCIKETAIGQHVEAEGKTGKAVQRKSQRDHQKFVVEKNGGIYILFHTVDELMEKMKLLK